MGSLRSLLSLAHLIGLALGLGGATVKLALLLRCRADTAFVATFMGVVRPITRIIISGMVVLTLSGVGFLMIGYPLRSTLVVKLAMVGALWVLGPVIDNVAEPKFRLLAPEAGAQASPEFVRAERRYLAMEALATGLFYAVVIMWVLR